jgi:hypothetical protein
MLYDTRNNTIYGFWVEISTVFNIHVLEHLWFLGCGTTPYYHDLHATRCYLTQETRIYMDKRWEISTVFKIFGHFLFKGVRVYTVWSWYMSFEAPWQTEQKYIQFRGGEFNSFKKLKEFPYRGPTRFPGTMTLTNLYYVWKLLSKFELFGPIGSWEKYLLNMFPIYAHIKTVSLIVAPSDPREQWIYRLAFDYVRKLSCKFQLFWSSGSWQEDVQNISLYKHMRKQFSILWHHPTSAGHDLKKKILFYCIINLSYKFWAFMAYSFLITKTF